MQAYNTQTGIVCPLDRANVDTDQIIAKQFLKSIKRTGFGVNLFDDWRYLDEGYPGQDSSTRVINPDFVLNQPRYQGATILLARRNFGCGSSREHAAIALKAVGIGAIIAESFARIFYRNAINLGIPLLICPKITSFLKTGESLGVNLLTGQISTSKGEIAQAEPLSEYMLHILQSGGIKPLIKAQMEAMTH